MNILILEDDPYRIRQFKMNLIGHYVAVVDTPADFEYLYKRADMKWDIVFLDYDLDQAVDMDLNPEYRHDYENVNGMKVVEHIIAKETHPSIHGRTDRMFVVHSANDPAAKLMLEALRKAKLRSIRFYGCWQSDKLIQDIDTIFASKELSNHDTSTRLPTPDYWRYSEII